MLRGLVNYLSLVLVAGTLTYLLAASSLDPRSNYLDRNPPPSPASVSATLDAYNLNPDTPLLSRVVRWADDIAHGDLGRTVTGGEVNEEFARRAGVSLRLLFLATLVGSIGGILIGTYSAVRQNRWPDRAATLASFVVLATPLFVTAVTAQLLARDINEFVGITVIEYTGEYSPATSGTWDRLVSRAQHLVLPSLVLIVFQIGIFSRYQRNTILDVLNSDFLRTARAKGLPARTVLLKHGVRVAVLPLVPLLVYNVVLLFTGAVFIEKIFGWHGMGEWLVDSIATNDVNAVAAVGLFTAALVLVAGLLSDAVYTILDPRSRTQA